MLNLIRAFLALALMSAVAQAVDKPYMSNIGPQGPGPVYVIDPNTGLASVPGASAIVTGITSGQIKIATTNTAVCLSAAALVNGIVVKALAGNAAAITLGGAAVNATTDGTGNGYVLAAGEAVSFSVDNASRVCINGSSGAGVSYVGN